MEVAVQAEVAPVDDAEDFRAWVAPHLVAMGRLATRLTSRTDRDHVVQRSLVRAWQRRSRFDETRDTAQAWLLRIVVDRAHRHHRGRGLARRLVAARSTTAEAGASRDLDSAIATLPKRQRLAVELSYLLGLEPRECALVMHCSEVTLASTLFDAQTHLTGFIVWLEKQ
jgi:RNA polymerase sigma factor (sigma-70 family)